MREYYPLLIIGAVIGVISAIFVSAYLFMKNKKEMIGFDRNMKDSELMLRLARYARPYIGSFLIVGLLMLVSIAYDILSPIIIGMIEERVKDAFELSWLMKYVALYSGILIVSLVCTYFQSIILQRTGQRIMSVIREELFDHIESLSHEQLTHIPVGTLVTRVTNDTNAISITFTNILVNLFKNVFIIVGVLTAMLCLNYELTLMLLCFVPFILLFTVIFRKFSRRAHRLVKDGTTDINIFLSENLSGIKVTQIFNREARKLSEFEQRNKKLARAKRQQILVFGIFRPMVYLLYISSVLCLFYLGGRSYIKNTVFLGKAITGGTIVTFYMYLSKFFNPIQTLAEQFHRLQSAFASAEKIFTVLDIEPKLTDSPDAIELQTVRGEIEFKNVWFAYIPGEWVLKDVSFHIMPGETAAFVGPTGSGKSTILSLICRNYDIERGEILVDGINIKKIKIASLRRHFGQMLQDVFLFSGTVRSNIVLREDGFTDEQVREACRQVGADTFINRFADGLDETVRERGNNFSAGQRQLLSFARTLLHKPSVMILDEATANIDTETEILIQNSLEKMKSIGTMLVVAHRLSTIRSSDRIYLLSHGEIVEQGNHDELISLHGRYYRLYSLQYDIEQRSETAAM